METLILFLIVILSIWFVFYMKEKIKIYQIGKIRDTTSLIDILRDNNKNVRLAAIRSLGRIGPLAVEPLLAVFMDSNSDVRKCVVEALAKISDARAVEPLIDALKDSDPVLRWYVAEALGEIGDARAEQPLIAVLKDNDLVVRKNVAEALEKIGWKPDKDATGAWYWIAKSEWNQCTEMGEPAIDPLIATLNIDDATVRLNVVKALGQIGNIRAVRPLVAALKDSNSDVKWSAAKALDSNQVLLSGKSTNFIRNIIEDTAAEIRYLYSRTNKEWKTVKETVLGDDQGEHGTTWTGYVRYSSYEVFNPDPDWDGINNLWKEVPKEFRKQVRDLSGEAMSYLRD